MRNKKRVLFLERNLRNEKLGVMYLSASLKLRGHDAILLQTDKEDVGDCIRDYKPDFVAFSITTGEHPYALKTAASIKEQYGIPNIFGGPHCTFFPELAIEPSVDFVVQGQGEHAIVDIVEGRIAPGFHKADMAEHLDDLPFPDRDIFYVYPEFRDNPMKNAITSRACPYKCSYCFNHSQLALTKIDGETKQWFDRRSVENVVKELNEVRERYPLEKVLYIDDSFIQSRDWLDEFLTGYTEQVRLPWLCSLRVNCLDKPLAERMFASGLEMVNYAMESADPDVQQRLLHRGHISNGDVIHAISLFDRFGIRARMQNMIGLPLTNPLEDALNTLQFNMRHRVTDSWCSIFQPYPRTALGQYCVDHNYCSIDQLRHCSESFFDESRLDIANKDEIFALQKLWYYIIDGNLPLDLVQILIRGRFTSETGDALQRLRFKSSRKKLYGIDDADGETACDLQSRERWQYQETDDRHEQPDSAALIGAAFRDIDVPDRLVDIISSVEFPEQEMRDLNRFVQGEQVHAPPLYTIDDDTGDLKHPDVSIFKRGTASADENDIRTMPEEHFMHGMADVRSALGTLPEKENNNEELIPVGVLANDGDAEMRSNRKDTDERHLNQYLA